MSGSGVGLDIVAVFDMVPVAVGLTVTFISRAGCEPTPISNRVHVTRRDVVLVPLPGTKHCPLSHSGFTLRNVTAGGNVSDMVTEEAVLGPLLVTCRV